MLLTIVVVICISCISLYFFVFLVFLVPRAPCVAFRYEASYDEWDNITSIDKRQSKRDMNVCKFDVVITTYEMCHKDAAFFQAVPWRLLVVDEAHKLKNDRSNLSLMLRTINRNATLLLTGTPLQNDTKELWSLLNFLDDQKFHDAEEFMQSCGEVTDAEGLGKLHDMLGPYMLRRMKEDGEKEITLGWIVCVVVGVGCDTTAARLFLTLFLALFLALCSSHSVPCCWHDVAVQWKRCKQNKK